MDIPILGFSLSAPIFFLIAVEVFFYPRSSWQHRYKGWILLAVLIWIGIFLSTAINGLIRIEDSFDLNGGLTVIRYAYWLLVFIVTCYFVSQNDLGNSLLKILVIGVVLLGFLRLAEAIILGKNGAWTYPVLLTQNEYGFIFSMFTPMLTSYVLSSTNWRSRLFGTAGFLVVISAVAINGSRGSWIAIATSMLVYLVIYLSTNPARLLEIGPAVALGCIVISLLVFAPSTIVGTFNKRFATLQQLDEDKSYAIRLLMDQKAIRLFEDSPLIGIGANRFTQSSVRLEIPQLLRYAPQSHFDVKSPHNSYLAFLSETGLIGFIPFILLLIMLIFGGLHAAVSLIKRGEKWGLAVYSGFLGMSIHMWSISSLTNTANWFMYGLVAAMIVCSSLGKKRFDLRINEL